MKTFDSYELLITPLSPVHIGTGDSYDPTNYVIEGDALYEFDSGEVVEVLSKPEREELLRVVDRRPSEEMIKAVQRFFYGRRSLLIHHARNRLRVLEGVATLYRERVGQTAQHEQGGRQVINRLEIDRTAFNLMTRLPLLFGSSLKGAIRTALLDKRNNGQPRRTHTDRPRTEGNADLQHRLFAYRPGKFELDPLRLVQISDAAWQGDADVPPSEVHFAVNRKKVPVRDERGRLRASQAEQKNLYQILECVAALRHRAFRAQLNIQKVDGVDKPGELPSDDLRFTIQDIARACNDFYRAILSEESRLLAERGFLSQSWYDDLRELMTGELGQLLDSNQAFLLRAGRHSGAESVTLRGVREIRIMTGRGQSELASGAKTVWLAAREPGNQQELLPFGWLLVEVAAGADRYPETCSALKKVCESHLRPARDWAARQAQLAEERAQQQAESEARRRQEEQQARLRVEQEQRAARLDAERQARLAAMSPEERAIEDLRVLYDGEKAANRKEPQGELAQRRAELLKQAKSWSAAEMRRKAAELIEETTRWVPWPKKKQTERQKELDELRNP
ncbi:MAG: RAMP superfamily CRISPR-associated protein [Acidobacteriota bacterium]